MLNSDDFLAYGKEHHAIESVMRLQAVKRWHMIDTTRTQNLAEHSANVAVLAAMIAFTAPSYWFDSHTSIAMAALVHDIAEAFTGDIPSHTKRYLVDIKPLEQSVIHPVFNMDGINDHSKALIKLCDLADGIRFIRLHGIDMTANHAQEGLEDQIIEKLDQLFTGGWPENILDHVRSHVMFYAYERE